MMLDYNFRGKGFVGVNAECKEGMRIYPTTFIADKRCV